MDCSTYLLYPPSKADLDQWHQELRAAAVRVETVEKRKSGAEELAMRRRLALLPRTRLVTVTLVRVLVSPDEDRADADAAHTAAPTPAPTPTQTPTPTQATSALPSAADAASLSAIQTAPVDSKGGLACHPPTTGGGSKLSLADRIRNSALRTCFVRVRSHAAEGTTAEEVVTDKAPLVARDAGHGLAAAWAGTLDGGGPGFTAAFGAELSLLECDRLSLTVRAETVVGQSIELGRCSVPLEDVDFQAPDAPPLQAERWLDVRGKRGSGKTVARLLVRIGGVATGGEEGGYNS